MRMRRLGALVSIVRVGAHGDVSSFEGRIGVESGTGLINLMAGLSRAIRG